MGNGLWKCSVSIAVCTDDSGELSDGISIRYRYSSMSRTSKTRYAVTKMAVAIGTGAAIAVLSRLLFLGLTALIVYKIHGQVLVGGEDTIEAMSRTSLLVIQRKYAQYLMLFILEDSLYASILPGIALIVSLFVKNRYVVMLSSYIYCEGWT